MRELDDLFARNKELQELKTAYREMAELRRCDLQASKVLSRAILGRGTQIEARETHSPSDRGFQIVAGDGICGLHSHHHRHY